MTKSWMINLKKYFLLIVCSILTTVIITGILNHVFTNHQNQISSGTSPDNYEFVKDFVKYEPENNNPVDEELVSQIIYLNPQNIKASDSNPGTEELPLKTLTKATEIAKQNYQSNLGTKVIIYPGIYRESVLFFIENKKQNAPIIFEAKEPGKVIISGSDIWKNWTQEPNSKIYTHNWPYKWKVGENPWAKDIEVKPIVRRKEIVFVNGKLLKQKLSFNELKEGNFYISEEAEKIYIYPESGTDIENSTIEVGTRNTLFLSKGISNLVIRGITFQHATSNFFRDSAVSINSGNNILVENSQFLWNNFQGLHIKDCQNVIVRNIAANYNGHRGISGYKLRNALYEDVESSYNNWRGDWGGFYGWHAGQKFFFLRNVTFRRYKAFGNMASGLWLDTDNINVWIDLAQICNNFHTGLYIEASYNILVSNSKICRNRANPESLFHHPGIFGFNASYVTLENNLICGNERSQIKVYVDKKRQVTDGYTKEKYLLNNEDWVLKNNKIIGENASQLLIYLQPSWQQFTGSWISNNNTWYNPDTSNSFQIKDNREKAKSFKDWQSIVGLDKESVFAKPQGKLDCY